SGMALANGKPSGVLSVLKKTGSNTGEVATNIEEDIEEMIQDHPSEVNLDVIIDTSDFIEMSIDSVIQNILIGGIISIFILLLYLKSVRATIVIGLSIPIAI
ncbi:efflux RND transporter permease subunit, partial [Virgibacillus salexigens]|uniref:efflux RND transporter permease subunit n=1 Tax=Virgibacillus salexigens TaxID=61016 RepID=UPI0019093BA2